MSQDNTGDEQERTQGLGEAAYGDEGASDRLEDRMDEPKDLEQEGQQEQQRGDSAAAVSSDAQFADPRQGSDGASFSGQSSQGDMARGESTVFGEPQQGETSYGNDQDAEPPRGVQGEPPQSASAGNDSGETSYGEDQDAEPSQQ